MTRPERDADAAESGKTPIYCPGGAMSQGNPYMIGEFDTTGLYLWCRRCRKAHYLSFGQLQKAVSQLSTRPDASTSSQAVV